MEKNIVQIESMRPIKPAMIDAMWKVCRVVDNWRPNDDMSMDRQWIFVVTSRGARIPCIIDGDNTLTEMILPELSSDIGIYIKDKLDILASQSRWSFNQQTETAKFVLERSINTVPIDSVKRIAWKDDPSPAFARMPFNRAVVLGDPMETIKEACPVFHEFLSRFESPKQAKAYCSFIGSIILDEDNKTHRGVILYGEGRNGKSAQLRMLDSILNKAVVYKNCKADGDFRTEGMERSRLVVYADVNDRNLFGDALTKSLVGGDKIEINRKGERQFTCQVRVKVIACTNKLPNIRDNVAEKRRWIFCNIAGFDGVDDPVYQEKLNAEAEWIVGCCCDMYETGRLGNDIDVDEAALDEVTSTADADVEYFCEQHFVREETGRVRGCNIAALLSAKGSKIGKDRVIGYLKKHYGAQNIAFREDFAKDIVVKGWGGISLRRASKVLLNYQDSAEVT
jgi:hypothetical protein